MNNKFLNQEPDLHCFQYFFGSCICKFPFLFCFYTFRVYFNALIWIIKTSSGNTLMIQHKLVFSRSANIKLQESLNISRENSCFICTVQSQRITDKCKSIFQNSSWISSVPWPLTKWLTQPKHFHSVCMRKVLFLFMCCSSSSLFIFYVSTVCFLYLITFFWGAKDGSSFTQLRMITFYL